MTKTDSIRAVIYISKLAIEIALKALLEKAGVPVKTIRAKSHDLAGLLVEVGRCKIEVDMYGSRKWVSAARICGVQVDDKHLDATIGTIVTAEERGASKYPQEIRYGSRFSDYPPDVILKTAVIVVAWAREHWDSIRVPTAQKIMSRGKQKP
jgi:hypothetical protein